MMPVYQIVIWIYLTGIPYEYRGADQYATIKACENDLEILRMTNTTVIASCQRWVWI